MKKKTKIVCTIGPTSWDPEVMKKMIENGMDAARVNGAFADPEEMDKVKKLVRDVSDKVSLILDIKGPEVRMNKFPEPIQLTIGQEIVIGDSEAEKIYPANYPGLYKSVEVGQKILVGDGDVELEVMAIKEDKMYCSVIYGELLKPGKALNLPGCNYATEVLTAKDKINLEHAIKTGWDFVSPSFIQNRAAAQEVKDFIKGTNIQILAKIEDQEGVNNIDDILEIVDGVLVARGGLGVELGLSKVHEAQKILVEKSARAGKPVIVATQMLESMITNPRPTRAEANDVASAIEAGADAIMLSGESSIGKYPAEAVAFMAATALEIESNLVPKIIDSAPIGASSTADALAKAAAELCIDMNQEIDKVIIVSKSGTTARILTRHSINQPIYVYVSEDIIARTLLLSKNIIGAYKQDAVNDDRDDAVQSILKRSKEEGIIISGEKVLLICKTPKDGGAYFPNIFEVIDID